MGAPRAIALCRCFGGFLDFHLGRWSEAEAALREAVALYRQVGSASGEALSLQRLGVLLTARGELSEGQELMSEGLFVAERAVMRSHCLTRLYASLARNRLAAREVEAAAELLAASDEVSRRHGCCLTCNALLLPESVRVALARGEIRAGDAHARTLEAISREFASPVWEAIAVHARARVLLASGEGRRAAEAFSRARRTYREYEARYEAARCLLGQAEALKRGGARELGLDAEALSAQAREELRALGSPGLED